MTLEQFSNLDASLGTLIHNDGTESQQVVMKGTIPISYQGATYNIPIEVFVMLRHPREMPRVYVRPIATMMIKPGHTFVNADGLVGSEPVLRSIGGSYNSSYELVNYLLGMATLFGQEPPLFTRPKPRVQVYNHGANDTYSNSSNDGGYQQRQQQQYASPNTVHYQRQQQNGQGGGAVQRANSYTGRLQLNKPPSYNDGSQPQAQPQAQRASSFASSSSYHALGAQHPPVRILLYYCSSFFFLFVMTSLSLSLSL
jgi:hypothetical protein